MNEEIKRIQRNINRVLDKAFELSEPKGLEKESLKLRLKNYFEKYRKETGLEPSEKEMEKELKSL